MESGDQSQGDSPSQEEGEEPKKKKGSPSDDDSSSEEEQKPKKKASRKASPKAAPKKKQSCSDGESPSEEQPDNGGAEEVPAHNNPPLYPHVQQSTMLNTSVQVEEILDQRKSKKDGDKYEFKIRWKGYGPKEDTWEIEDNVHCEDLLKAFWGKRRESLDVTLAPHSEDDESEDDEPEVAGHSADVLPAEELSIVQVVEIELSKEQVDKLERR